MAPTKKGAKKSTADDFQKIITDARERKLNEQLANKIFSRDRRQSAPSKLKAQPGGSLASRAGVKKASPDSKQLAGSAAFSPLLTNLARSQSTAPPRGPRASLPANANINSSWTHDLYQPSQTPPTGPSLASRISLPSSSAANKTRAGKRAARIAAAVAGTTANSNDPSSSQINILHQAATNPAKPQGLTIRGLAGPFTVMAQNFAPGTTEADIESAMTPVGGDMVSCTLVKQHPFLIAEMVFASREGGERVIETFNDKTADGRLIKVYPKVGASSAPKAPPTGPAASRRDQVVDGKMGFAEGTASADHGGSRKDNSNGLYSDEMVGRGSRGGRGTGRGNRGGRG